MNTTTGHTQGKVTRQAIRVAKVITPARLLRGLAMGALLIAATTFVYQELRQGEADSLSSSNQVTETAAVMKSEEHKTEGMPSDAGHNSTIDRTLSNIELERIDYEADLMLRAAAHNPSESSLPSNGETAASTGRAPHNRVLVDQLDDAEERVYDELSKNFIGIPYNDSHHDDIAIEGLERQLSSLLAEAARGPTSNTLRLNRQIERLDSQIDMIRINAMRDASVGRPPSSDEILVRSDRPYPDTSYYRDPDWREGQTMKGRVPNTLQARFHEGE